MTTPQHPDGGDTPQDPANPQNPYGTPPPPPPAPPASPVPTSPPVPPAYAPAAPYGQSGLPTGVPQQMGPMPGQQGPYPTYTGGMSPMPGAPGGPAQPGKGMAIAALVIGILGCTVIGALVAIPLAIVVLVRSRNGQNHGKGLAIGAIIASLLSLAVTVALVAFGVYVNGLTDVNDLKTGDCFTAHGLTDSSADSIDTIKTVSCSTKHDGEVLATSTVTADQAKDISKLDPEATCAPAIEAAGRSAVVSEDGVGVTALYGSKDPKKGDNIACVAYHVDGSKMTGKLS